ncbi:hypothetical protein [Marinilactibacillus piezotolerans]|uniref:hypothetical protein n=1 Tax=Marinilactibacillus piezotolerans TaxID=258723 RepID=UPI00117E0E95|nr:hypothetical protein [Marinilactibacillus piezotolerans]
MLNKHQEHQDDNEQLEGSSFSLRRPVQLTLLTYQLEPNTADVQWIKEQLAVKEIQIEVLNVPFETLNQHLSKADLIYTGTTINPSLTNRFYTFLLSEDSPFRYLYQNMPDLEKQLYSSFELNSRKQRSAALQQIEQSLIEEAAFLPIYSTYLRGVIHQDFMGVEYGSTGMLSFDKLFYL